MSLRREVNQSELEREEDCDEEPATREDVPNTIVEEADCRLQAASRLQAAGRMPIRATTSDYSTVGDDAKVNRGCSKAFRVCQRLPPTARTQTACL